MSSFIRYNAFRLPATQPVPKPVPGLKRALLIGINYIGTQYELAGCINDTTNMSEHLKKYYPMCKDHRVITDNTDVKPTKANILAAIKWLTADLKAGEHVFFLYSGHGGLVRDTNGDEVSGNDGCIYPLNGQSIEAITDDELRAALANTVPAGSKCFAVLDCCHSGTAVDLRCNWQVPTELSLIYTESAQYAKTAGQVIMLSGCQDDQTSADTVGADKRPCGALTWALLDTWKAYGTAIKMKYILWDVRKFLRTRGYTQNPQLTLGQYMDINTVFDMSVA
jgi:hypothetical protein